MAASRALLRAAAAAWGPGRAGARGPAPRLPPQPPGAGGEPAVITRGLAAIRCVGGRRAAAGRAAGSVGRFAGP